MEGFEKIEYWVELADYDIVTAEAMLETRRFLYVGFMCHQAIEKMTKALYVKFVSGIPPFTHSLIDLAQKTGIYGQLTEEQKDFIDLLQPLNIQARYPGEKDKLFKTLTYEKCADILKQTKELAEWIRTKLSQ